VGDGATHSSEARWVGIQEPVNWRSLGILGECAFSTMAQAQSAAGFVASKVMPFGKTFVLHVMEHVAAAGFVEGVMHIVTPEPPNKTAGGLLGATHSYSRQ
jgi:hypothetical protein